MYFLNLFANTIFCFFEFLILPIDIVMKCFFINGNIAYLNCFPVIGVCNITMCKSVMDVHKFIYNKPRQYFQNYSNLLCGLCFIYMASATVLLQ